LSILYADTSALVRAYFTDEPDHAPLQERLLNGADPVVTSELTRVELASASSAAVRGGRLKQARIVLDQFDADCADDGPLALIRLDPATVLPRARDLVCTHSLRTLDAMHLAVALGEVTDMAAGEPVVFVTRDAAQAAAARALGFETA
jgi:predicted nucleic acid-binding protein